MAFIKTFKNYMDELQQEVEGINKNNLVADASQLTNLLNNHQKTQNMLLLGVLPVFGNNSPASVDEYRLRSYSDFMILKKTDYSTLTDEVLVKLFDDTYAVAEELVKKITEDHESGECVLMKYLNVNSIQISEVFNKAQCNGWNITFTFDKTLF